MSNREDFKEDLKNLYIISNNPTLIDFLNKWMPRPENQYIEGSAIGYVASPPQPPQEPSFLTTYFKDKYPNDKNFKKIDREKFLTPLESFFEWKLVSDSLPPRGETCWFYANNHVSYGFFIESGFLNRSINSVNPVFCELKDCTHWAEYFTPEAPHETHNYDTDKED